MQLHCLQLSPINGSSLSSVFIVCKNIFLRGTVSFFCDMNAVCNQTTMAMFVLCFFLSEKWQVLVTPITAMFPVFNLDINISVIICGQLKGNRVCWNVATTCHIYLLFCSKHFLLSCSISFHYAGLAGFDVI